MQGRTDKQALRGFLVAITVPPALASLLAMVGAIQALPLFVPAIILAAYFGGARPGIVASVAATVAAGHFLLVEAANPVSLDLIRCGALLLAGITLSVLAELMRRPEVVQPMVQLPVVAAPVVVAAPAPEVRQRTRSIPMPMMHDRATLHDLNNALAVISGNVGLLAETFPVDHPDHEMMVDIEAAVVRAAQITRKLARERQTAAEAVRFGSV